MTPTEHIKTVTLAQQEINSLLRQTTMELEVEVQDLLAEDRTLKIVHISKRLKRQGLVHYHGYDQSKYNGMSLGIVENKVTGDVVIYPALFTVYQSFNTLEGRLEVLRRIKSNCLSVKEGLIECRHVPILLDKEEAYQYIKDHPNFENKTIRATVDWFIKKHVNVSKKVQEVQVLTRKMVADFESSIIEKMESQLNNRVELRILYQYNVVDPNFVVKSNKTIPDITSLTVEVKDPKDTDEATISTLKEALSLLGESVIRYVGDAPNRLHARYALLSKLNKQIA